MGSATKSVTARVRARRSAVPGLGLLLTAALALSACSGHHSSTASASLRPGSGAGSGGASNGASSSSVAGGSSGAGSAPTTAGAKPTSSAGGSAAAASTPTLAGAEGVTGGTARTCSIAGSDAVAAVFHARIGSTSVKTSAIGNPLCSFGLMTSNIGPAATSSGTVTLTLNPSTTAAQFAAVKASAERPVAVTGVGDQAYYVTNSSTLQILRGSKSVSAQAQMNAPAGTQYVNAIQADLVALGKVIVAQL